MPLPLPALLISTHTSRVGCDIVSPVNSFTAVPKFLLTHPVWDVTDTTLDIFIKNCISTHTSRVGCDGASLLPGLCNRISTHTSRVGCDIDVFVNATAAAISTHTSRVGCDYSCENIGMQAINFYSHIPCGM